MIRFASMGKLFSLTFFFAAFAGIAAIAENAQDGGATAPVEVSAFEAPAFDFNQPGPDGLVFVKNIVYREVGGTSLKGDLYRPAGDAVLPAVVVIHGGGFMIGNKEMEHYIRLAREIAADGYVVFNVDYRLIQDGGVFPESVRDVKCAVRWVKANAARIGVDAARVGALGGSAGGYLAAFLAGAPNHPKIEPDCDYGGDPSTEIKAAIVYFGLTDIRADSPNTSSFRFLLPRYIGKKNGGSPELQAAASPVTYASSTAPLLLLHGTGDSLVEHAQSVALCERATAAGRVCELHLFEGAEHAYISNATSPDSLESSRLSFEFLDKYLRN